MGHTCITTIHFNSIPTHPTLLPSQGLRWGFRVHLKLTQASTQKWPHQQQVADHPHFSAASTKGTSPLLFLSDLKTLESLIFQGNLSLYKSLSFYPYLSLSLFLCDSERGIPLLVLRIRREPIFLSSLLPIHTATASARLVSKLPREASMLSEGNSSSTTLESETLGMKMVVYGQK